MIAGIKTFLTVDEKLTVNLQRRRQLAVCSTCLDSGAAIAKARLPTVDSFTCGTTTRLVLVERSGRRPGKSSTRISGPG